jgi:hypothetical protein
MASIDTATLFLGLIFSSIGLGYFIYGKKQKKSIFRYVGITLMFYPYVFTNSVAVVLVGIALMFVPKFIKL